MRDIYTLHTIWANPLHSLPFSSARCQELQPQDKAHGTQGHAGTLPARDRTAHSWIVKAWSLLLLAPTGPRNKLSADQYRLGFSAASPSAFSHLLSQAPLKLWAFRCSNHLYSIYPAKHSRVPPRDCSYKGATILQINIKKKVILSPTERQHRFCFSSLSS